MASVDARSIALQCLSKYRKNSELFIADELQHYDAPAQDMALARELALGVVRFQRLYEYVVKQFLKQKSNQQLLLDVLSIAAHQIFMLDGIPAHAVGDSSVDLVKQYGHPEWAGVVNAVVHKLLSLRLEQAKKPALRERDLPKQAAIQFSFSDLFVKHIQRDFPKQWKKILSALNQVVPVCTRLKDAQINLDEVNGIIKRDGAWVWWERVQDTLRIVNQGAAVIQDRSQGYVAELANIKKNDRVLDICAAPGGKTQLAIESGGTVFSSDLSVKKTKKLSVLNEGRVFAQDACQPAVQADFDCVIVDAPCSNSGVFARRPEARWRYHYSELNQLEELQKNIIKESSQLVGDGGRLVYATCSINSDENMKICETLSNWNVEQVHLAKPDQWQAGGFVAVLHRK